MRGNIIHAHAEEACQRLGHDDVVALTEIDEPRNSLDVAQVEVVKAVFSAGHGENDEIFGQFLHELAIIVLFFRRTFAVFHQEELLDLGCMTQQNPQWKSQW